MFRSDDSLHLGLSILSQNFVNQIVRTFDVNGPSIAEHSQLLIANPQRINVCANYPILSDKLCIESAKCSTESFYRVLIAWVTNVGSHFVRTIPWTNLLGDDVLQTTKILFVTDPPILDDDRRLPRELKRAGLMLRTIVRNR